MAHIKSAVMVLILSMVLSLVLSYASIMSAITQTKDSVERLLDSFVVKNSTQIYNSIKNGNDFTNYLSQYDFKNRFSLDNTLETDGNFFYNIDSDGNTVYKMSSPTVGYTIKNSLNLYCTYNIYFPIKFAGKHFTNLIIPIRVDTSFNLKP